MSIEREGESSGSVWHNLSYPRRASDLIWSPNYDTSGNLDVDSDATTNGIWVGYYINNSVNTMMEFEWASIDAGLHV